MRYKSKFVWHELVENRDGKTSGSGFAGLVVTMAGVFTFLLGTLALLFTEVDIKDLLYQSIALIATGSTLLGVRKVTKQPEYNEQPPEEIPPEGYMKD